MTAQRSGGAPGCGQDHGNDLTAAIPLDRCREEFVHHAWKAAWIGLVFSVVGVIVAMKRRWALFIWPLVGIAVAVVGVVIGAQLINIAAGH